MAGKSSPPRSPNPQSPPIMSLEAALDEERREVMAALEGTGRSGSPSAARARNVTPPPIRSMLDVDMSRVPRHGSIAGIGVGITSPSQPRTKKLNPADPSTYTKPHTSFSRTTSPTEDMVPPRRSSEADIQSVGLPKIEDPSNQDIDHKYQFDMSPTETIQPIPLRAAQGEKRPREGSSPAMAAALSGDFSSLHVGLPKGAAGGRHNSTAGVGAKSRSPSSRFGQPDSPKSLSPVKYVTKSGKVINMDQAYRRLSNKSGNSGSFSTINSESETEARVPKDALQGEGDEAAVESSEEEEEDYLSSDEEDSQSRGRNRARRKKGSGSEADYGESETGEDLLTSEVRRSAANREAQSQMAAAEEERIEVSSKQPVKSLLEPSISITDPAGEKVAQTSKKTSVHPATSFDQPVSAATSAASSDADQDMADISKARKLAMNVSPIHQSEPERVVRVIIRGDWQTIQLEAEDGRRRQRTYLVATDLSDEAKYALEWTIGTILRDGDTLMAIYFIGDETMSDKTQPNTAEKAAFTVEGTKAAQDAERTMESLTAKTMTAYTSVSANHLSPSTYQPATETGSVSGSVDSRRVSKAQMERLHAVEDISQTCVRLLRKTRLQVRICVEVQHCKSPKHLITAAIDELEPTLVVLGSRGRSALKGVLLGSFSNYLVTKSSVPVMVARKKLRKHAKVHGSQVKLANNLILGGTGGPRRSLAHADIEKNMLQAKR